MHDFIIKWAQDAQLLNVNFDSQFPSGEKTLEEMESLFQTASMKPCELPCQLEGHGQDKLPVFNFEAMLASLLHNECLMQPENLVVRPENPAEFQEKCSLEFG